MNNIRMILARLKHEIKERKNHREIKSLDIKRLVPEIKARRLTYLGYSKLNQLLMSMREVNDGNVEGQFIEAGVALGGTLVLISGYSKCRNVLAFDTFGMIPEPTDKDPIDVHERYLEIVSGRSKGIDGDMYYGYRDDLYEFVSQQINDLCGGEVLQRTVLVKGKLQETMDLRENVAFAHIDVDWYDPVKHSLSQIWPRLSKNGIIVFDDYLEWGGCKKAVDEFFENIKNCEIDLTKGSLKVKKK